MDYDIGGLFAPNATQQRNQVNPLLTAGRSYEYINRTTGIPLSMIRSYADTTRPGYGVKKKVAGSEVTQSGAGGGGGYDAQEAQQKENLLAQLANQQGDIEAQLGRLGKTRDVGFGNIQSAYNQALNRLNEQKGIANRDYQTNTRDTVGSFLGARNNVASQTRARLDAIRQLLGASGSGASSASQYAAPYAAVREGTQTLAPVQSTYATNRRNLDVALGDAMRQYGNEQEDLGQQRVQQRRGLLSSIKQTRADLLEKLNQIGVARAEAQGGNIEDVLGQQAGRRNAINRLLDEIVGLGRQYDNPILRANNISFSVPELGEYDFDQMGEIATDVPGAEDFDPFLAPIIGNRDEEDLLSNLAV